MAVKRVGMNGYKSLVLSLFCLGFAAALVSAADQQAEYAGQEAEYAGHSQCRVCHNKRDEGEIWKVWSEKRHSKAFERLKTPEAKAVAERVGLTTPPHEAPDCLRCHVTAYDVEKQAPPSRIAIKDGVQCESCHGPASLHIQDGREVTMRNNTTIDITANIKRGNEATCLTCHNEESPTWDPTRYTLEDGTTTGFDYEAAWKKIEHRLPEK